jgi:putative colanic acid biosynthesis UDP-glucose lipid carrier transferase
MYDSPKSASLPIEAKLTTSGEEVRPKSRTISPAKRTFDFVVALILIVLSLPGLLFIALLVKLDSKGPVLFKQRRTGLNGRVFHIYKFRSMTVAEDGDAVVQARIGDKRVTRLGRILRRTSLDEIPQILNILLGDMSFVGPRPHAMAHDVEFSKMITEYDRRFGARPGLTGLAQVRGYRGEIRRAEDLAMRIISDIEYIENWSFRLDLAIFFSTIPVMFGHKNAY